MDHPPIYCITLAFPCANVTLVWRTSGESFQLDPPWVLVYVNFPTNPHLGLKFPYPLVEQICANLSPGGGGRSGISLTSASQACVEANGHS